MKTILMLMVLNGGHVVSTQYVQMYTQGICEAAAAKANLKIATSAGAAQTKAKCVEKRP